jgi:hypothetical protein
MSSSRIPFVASAMALGAGAVWSFGAVTARLAEDTDAFQYLIWRSVGIIVVVEAMAVIRRGPNRTIEAFTKAFFGGDFPVLGLCLQLLLRGAHEHPLQLPVDRHLTAVK